MDAPAIHLALASVMEDVGAVAKKDRNEHQRFLFRGIDAVVNAVSPALRAHKVVVVPRVQSVHYDNVQTSTGKPATACRVIVDYVFHGPAGDSISTTVIGEAWDNGDKAAPKAMSVAFRTALLQALALPTDDVEPDATTYERAAPTADAKTETTTRMARPRPAAPEEAVPSLITAAQSSRMFAMFNERNIKDRDQRLAGISQVVGRTVTSSKELTRAEASQVMESLSPPTENPPTEEPAGWEVSS